MSTPVTQPPQIPGAAPFAPPPQQQMVESVVAINGNTTGAQTIITAVTGKSIKVASIYFVVGSACTVTFNDNVVTDGALPLAANGSFTLDYRANGSPWFQTSAGSGFVLTTSVACPIVGRVYYTAL